MAHVIVPSALGPGSEFLTALPDGTLTRVIVPDGCEPGTTLIIGTPIKSVGALPTAVAYSQQQAPEEVAGQLDAHGGDDPAGEVFDHVEKLVITVPPGSQDTDILVKAPDGNGVYSVHVPQSAVSGAALGLQVPVYKRASISDAVSGLSAHLAAQPPTLGRKASSTLSEVLARTEWELAIADAELEKALDALTMDVEVTTLAAAPKLGRRAAAGKAAGSARDTGGTSAETEQEMLQMIVVGKLVRKRTRAQLMRDKSAYLEKLATLDEAQPHAKEHPGRAVHRRRALRRTLTAAPRAAWSKLRAAALMVGLRQPAKSPSGQGVAV